MSHTSVLLHEAIEGLAIKPGDVILDGTLNGGGHSAAICERFGEEVQVIGLDLDREAIERAKTKLANCNVIIERSNFRNLSRVLDRHGIKNINKMLLDLGLSSDQLEVSGRGFSFRLDEPLLMTFKSEKDLGSSDMTARDIVNDWEEESIANVLYGYGEERFARRIARAIVEARKTGPIETTGELVRVIESAVPRGYRHGKIHPATRSFQALRIAVNDELGALREALAEGFSRLSSGGRVAIISFHSLEDRIVKNMFKDFSKSGQAILITKKPIIPSLEEVQINPRARSSKLRIVEKK
ncbi:MAG: 16S rRNA (cytosine(1402)-N(4))-methyltransferase RsmH [bacterium]|nr:16S rRNA (cytosine(1402)-N(4))-methyltransferase RsmH [bacterium]